MADKRTPERPADAEAVVKNETDRHPSAYEIVSRERLLDMFFKVDKVVVAHEQFDGTMSPPKAWLVFERGDAAAALLFDPVKRVVLIVDQFRIPTVGKGRGNGWVVETAAGMIPVDQVTGQQTETPAQCMTREIEEETGYQVTELVPIATFFSSPGGSSERIYLFYAEVREVQKIGKGGGVDEGEDINVIKMPLPEFLRKLGNREFEDPKIIIAGQWLRERRQAEQATGHQPTDVEYFDVVKAPGKRVGFLTGDLGKVKHVADAWVNSENTDMMMDRFFDRSISATIRLAGAKKFSRSNRVEEDTIADDLERGLHGRKFVKLGTVVDTTAGDLKQTHGVRRIFHVATVQGFQGETGMQTDVETLSHCVDEVLAAVSKAGVYRSVLFPMIGTGNGGYQVRAVAPRLIESATRFLETHKNTKIETVVFLGFSTGDGDILAQIMDEMKRNERLT